MVNLTEKEKKSGRQYRNEFLPAMVAYVAVLFAAKALLKYYPDTIWDVPIAISPSIPIIFGLFAMTRFIGRMDELMKKIFTETAAITLMLVTMVAFSYGFLENQGYPHLDLIWSFPIVCFVFGAVFFFVRRRYNGE